MSRSYAETALIRKASEERISNRWKKHSGLTQSSQQLKRDIILIPFEEELDEVFPANKAKKELILLRMPFLGLHKSKVWNKHMVPFCLLCCSMLVHICSVPPNCCLIRGASTGSYEQ